jgi:hypothetical protein
MGKFVFSNAYFAMDNSTGGAYNASSYVRSLTLNYSRAEVDKTCMLDEGIGRLSGLYDWSMDVEFAQDFTDNTLDEIIFGAMGSTLASLTFSFRPTTASAGASNPEYRGEGWIFEYTPLTGSVGDLSTASVSIRCVAASSAANTKWLKRATA